MSSEFTTRWSRSDKGLWTVSVLVRDRTWVRLPRDDWGDSLPSEMLRVYTLCKVARRLFATHWDLGINNFSTAWYDTFNEQPHITFRDE